MDKNVKYLYRALRKEEIDAGNILIPRKQETFKKLPLIGIDTRIPFVVGKTEEYAVRQHIQRQQKELPPSVGISTTPHFERAKNYNTNGVIVKINRSLFNKYGIKEYVVKEYLGKFLEDIALPEDDEVILVKEGGGDFPKKIIKEVISKRISTS